MSEGAGQDDSERVVVLGRITAPFGVSGWVKVHSYTDPLDNILNYEVWRVGAANRWTEVRWRDSRVTATGIQVQLEGVSTRDQAELLRGSDIAVRRSELPSIESGEFYWDDLIGLSVYTPEGQLLGVLDHIRETPAHPLLVIRGEREHWVPFVKQRLHAVDLPARRMTVDWQADW